MSIEKHGITGSIIRRTEGEARLAKTVHSDREGVPSQDQLYARFSLHQPREARVAGERSQDGQGAPGCPQVDSVSTQNNSSQSVSLSVRDRDQADRFACIATFL